MILSMLHLLCAATNLINHAFNFITPRKLIIAYIMSTNNIHILHLRET